MAVGSLYVIVVFEATSAEHRDAVLDHLTKIAGCSKSSEPGTSKYCVAIPRDAADDRTVYCIEEYADQLAKDIHMSSAPVDSLFRYLSTTQTALARPPTVMTMSPLAAFTRPEIASYKDPALHLAELGSGDAVVHPVAEAARRAACEAWSDPGLLCTAALRDVKEPTVRLLRVGRKGEGAAGNGPGSVALRVVAGYLWKCPEDGRSVW